MRIKKAISILMVVMLMMGIGLTASASLPETNPISGNSQSVTKSIKSGTGYSSLTVYYNTTASKDQLGYVNAARVEAGLAKLSWNSKMEDAALIRAMEQYFAPSHTRPDGSKFNTVDSLVNGENLAGGTDPDYYSGKTVFDDWMGSTGHRTNILDKDFKSMAAVSIFTDTGSYWVQLFSADSGSDTTEKTTTEKTTTEKVVTTTAEKAAADKSSATTGIVDGATTTTTTTNTNVGAAILENMKKITGDNASIKVENGTKLTAKELGDINALAAAKTLTIHADTLYTGGKTQGRIFLMPNSLKGRTTDYKLGVYTDATVKSVKDKFASYFGNKTAIIKIDEVDLGVSTRLAVNVDLTGMDTKNLVFYTYNATENKYYVISKPNYSVDNNGFLHFYTSVGGYIIVSDGNLAKK